MLLFMLPMVSPVPSVSQHQNFSRRGSLCSWPRHTSLFAAWTRENCAVGMSACFRCVYSMLNCFFSFAFAAFRFFFSYLAFHKLGAEPFAETVENFEVEAEDSGAVGGRDVNMLKTSTGGVRAT